MAFLRMSGLALATVMGLSLPIGQATAMPANGLAVAVKQVPERVEEVRLVCGPYRCWSTSWHYGWHRHYTYWGWRRPLYAYAGPYWHRPLYAYAGPYWHRPLYAYAGPYWHRHYTYWGWRRPLYAYAGPAWGLAPTVLCLRRTGVGLAPSALCLCQTRLGLAPSALRLCGRPLLGLA